MDGLFYSGDWRDNRGAASILFRVVHNRWMGKYIPVGDVVDQFYWLFCPSLVHCFFGTDKDHSPLHCNGIGNWIDRLLHNVFHFFR